MHEVIPSRLWIGNVGDARDVRSILNLGVEAIVDLACDELPAMAPRDIVYLRIPIVDGTGNAPQLLKLAVKTMAYLIGCGTPTFVFCSAGLSRAPAIVSAALALVQDADPDESLKALAERTPHDVSPGLWNEVKAACNVSHG